jgi:hypothetical protein
MHKKYFQLFFIFLLLLFFDYSILNLFELKELNVLDALLINFFLFFLTLLFFLLYQWLLKKKKSPFTYLSLSFFKMVISLIFLYPIYSNNSANAIPYVLHFFALYFAYLFIEIFLLIKDSR